ncbi:MAG: hypothetical protein P4L81_00315 [Candidatus Pacebacteria bacterium]|nr:hypothetical protein [Candidatus Paceibacterota bacterium]
MDPFEDFARTRGGVVEAHPNSVAAFFKARWQQIIDESIASIFRDKSTVIRIGWLARENINATVSKVGAAYVVGINAPTPSVFMLLFNRFMRDPETFPNIGKPASSEQVVAHEASRAQRHEDPMSEVPAFPSDPDRARWARGITRIALDFFFVHEITHISHDHLDWIIKQGSSAAQIVSHGVV